MRRRLMRIWRRVIMKRKEILMKKKIKRMKSKRMLKKKENRSIGEHQMRKDISSS
jgi:hypothetical protein